MPLLFSENDINYMKEMKNIFDSKNNFNPGKIFPEMSDAIEQPK